MKLQNGIVLSYKKSYFIPVVYTSSVNKIYGLDNFFVEEVYDIQINNSIQRVSYKKDIVYHEDDLLPENHAFSVNDNIVVYGNKILGEKLKHR